MDWLRSRFELPNHELRSMQGMRGLAVFLVFLVHYSTLSQSADPVVIALHSIGNSGVDLFFVLSGFLIYGSLIRRPHHYGRFMARRVERIYPAFTAVFITYIALSFAFPHESKIPAGVSGWFYLVQNFLLLPGMFPIAPMITVAWSLSYEMFFYLTMPLAVVVLRLRERSPRFRLLLIGGSLIVYGVICVKFGGLERLLMFGSGMILYEIMQAGVRAPGIVLTLGALLLGIASSLFDYGVLGSVGQVAVMFAAFMVACLGTFQSGALERVFAWTPVRWLGNMSYSYYLIHGLSLKGAFLFISGPVDGAGFWMLMPLMFALTLVPSAALFLLIERPISLAR